MGWDFFDEYCVHQSLATASLQTAECSRPAISYLVGSNTLLLGLL